LISILQELVFCGPDEGTADYMDWAAVHAKERGYAHWSAFTTGKSTELGGIPHDLYGMVPYFFITSLPSASSSS